MINKISKWGAETQGDKETITEMCNRDLELKVKVNELIDEVNRLTQIIELNSEMFNNFIPSNINK